MGLWEGLRWPACNVLETQRWDFYSVGSQWSDQWWVQHCCCLCSLAADAAATHAPTSILGDCSITVYSRDWWVAVPSSLMRMNIALL